MIMRCAHDLINVKNKRRYNGIESVGERHNQKRVHLGVQISLISRYEESGSSEKINL